MIRLVYSFEDFINESKKQKFKKGCVMVYADFPDDITEIHDAIEEDDIFTKEGDRTFGLDKESHVTLLYGLDKTVTKDQVKEVIKDLDFGKLNVHNLSIFDNPEYDVLKFDVDAKSLNKGNKLLTDALPYENDFPDYHAHMTVAYLKKGKGKKYVKMFKDKEFKIEPTKIVYSQPSGKKSTILTLKKNVKDK